MKIWPHRRTTVHFVVDGEEFTARPRRHSDAYDVTWESAAVRRGVTIARRGSWPPFADELEKVARELIAITRD